MTRKARKITRGHGFAATVIVCIAASYVFGMEDQPVFVDVTEASGIRFKHEHGGGKPLALLETKGPGLAVFDYNNDGYLDAYFMNGRYMREPDRAQPTNALYRNNGDGTFTDVTEEAGVGDSHYGMGAMVADYDNDGYNDLYLTNYGSNVLYHNNGDGTFTDVTEQAGVGDDRFAMGACFTDYDNDGYVDLYVPHYVDYTLEGIQFVEIAGGHMSTPAPYFYKPLPDLLYHNNGDGTFTDVTEAVGVNVPPQYGLNSISFDYDDDGDLDIYVANDGTPNFLFSNQGDGTFEEVALEAGLSCNQDGEMQASMGMDIGDYDHDGLMDILLTHFQQEYCTIYHNDGEGFFSDETFSAGLAEATLSYLSWGTNLFDYDNDGHLDILIVNGHVQNTVELFDESATYAQRKQLFKGDGQGYFEDVSAQSGEVFSIRKVGRGAGFGDLDNDGDIDLIVSHSNGYAEVLRNEVGHLNHRLTVKVIGVTSNRNGIGAKVEVTAGALFQVDVVKSGGSFLSHGDFRLSFGLGQHTQVDRVEVKWPSGIVDHVQDIPADQMIVIKEGEGIIENFPFAQ